MHVLIDDKKRWVQPGQAVGKRLFSDMCLADGQKNDPPHWTVRSAIASRMVRTQSLT